MIDIINKFNIEGRVLNIEECNGGLVNKSYKVTTCSKVYLLQIINHYVFRDVEGLMNNIYEVTNHLKKKNIVTLDIITTKEGRSYYYDDTKDVYYRIYRFLDNVENINLFNDKLCLEIGKVIGNFQLNLVDFDGNLLTETIKDFHNVSKRIIKLKESYNSKNLIDTRKNICNVMYLYIIDNASENNKITESIGKGIIPIRISHNDTKYNNIMFDKISNTGSCLIDLDTVMPGCILFDYADAIRSACSKVSEDDTNIGEVDLIDSRFIYLTIGYLSRVYTFISKDEVNLMVKSIGTIIFECAVRFLTDYLDNDIYFKTNYNNHNYDRALNQLKLYEKFLEKEEKYNKYLEIIYKRIANDFNIK